MPEDITQQGTVDNGYIPDPKRDEFWKTVFFCIAVLIFTFLLLSFISPKYNYIAGISVPIIGNAALVLLGYGLVTFNRGGKVIVKSAVTLFMVLFLVGLGSCFMNFM
jgi:hypothetical protein